MPMPVRSLPVVQNWDCRGCGECCRSYHVRVSDAERAALQAHAALADGEPVVWDPAMKGHRLNHRPDGSCVFLGADNRCRIHAEVGSAAKPMACRVYPFVLVPAGDHWRVGVRYACPAAVENHGRPMAKQAAEAREYAALVEADAGAAKVELPPPELQPGQAVAWPDLVRFAKAVGDLIADGEGTVEFRLRKVVALAALCKQSRFDTLAGKRLDEFFTIIKAAVGDAVPERPEQVPPPGWVGRMVFRQTAAVYARKDTGPNPGIAARGRWTRIRAAWRFARGTGRVPKLHGLIPDGVRFADAETPAGGLSKESEALLTRYYRTKVESMQFCGPTNFGRRFWDGLDALLLTFPAILWLARVLAAGGARPMDDAVALAVRIADDNFGFNPLLGAPRMAWAVRTLADRGEIARLVAWYAR